MKGSRRQTLPPAELRTCSACGRTIPWDSRRAAAYASRQRCDACGRGRRFAPGRRRLASGKLYPKPLGNPRPRPAAMRYYSLARVPAVYRRPYTLDVWLVKLHAQVSVPISSARQHCDFVRSWLAGEWGAALILLHWRYAPLLAEGESYADGEPYAGGETSPHHLFGAEYPASVAS